MPRQSSSRQHGLSAPSSVEKSSAPSIGRPNETFSHLNDTIYATLQLIQEVLDGDHQDAIGSSGTDVCGQIADIRALVTDIETHNKQIEELSLKLSELDAEFRSALMEIMGANNLGDSSKRSYKKHDVKKLISQNLTPKMTSILEETNETRDQLRTILTTRDTFLEDIIQKVI